MVGSAATLKPNWNSLESWNSLGTVGGTVSKYIYFLDRNGRNSRILDFFLTREIGFQFFRKGKRSKPTANTVPLFRRCVLKLLGPRDFGPVERSA
jgi:hypothetical protein